MTKRIQILIAFIYLLGVIWMPLHTHFCGTELTSLNLFTGEFHADTCDCSEVGGGDCCSDRIIKVDQKVQNIRNNIIQSPFGKFTQCFLHSQPRIGFFDPIQFQKYVEVDIIKLPPNIGRTYIELRVFRI